MEQNELLKLRHSCEHVLHQAMVDLFPGLKRAMGPATNEGFYLDFDYDGKITEADFPRIEKRMQEIIKADLPIIRQEISVEKAREMFKDNSYKLEWVDQIEKKGEKATVYWNGEPGKEGSDVDLCKGPHVESTGKVGPFKLLSVAGAYWHGDEKNKMLTRIYGTCFPTKDELDKYLWQIEEAKKRDHRKLGKELDLYVFSDLVGPGLPLFTFKGTVVRSLIANYSRKLRQQIGYHEVHTPQINKAELFKVSGHYEKYKDDMFEVRSHYSNEMYYLKPMNCPQHTQIYASQKHSYRDLPMRIADLAMLYRDEKPGELSGLTRLRAFAQDDGHTFCREDQIKDEFKIILPVIKQAMTTYNMNYYIRLSLRDENKKEKYLGDNSVWEKSQKILEELLKEQKVEYIKAEGEAAFYGPKMDLMAKDSLGREWQLSTIQLDFNMPKRFGLEYIGEDGKPYTPVMIHSAIVGSPDRFMGVLIEHYGGAFPLWLAPVQIKILPISEKHLEFAKKVNSVLSENGMRSEIDEKNTTVGHKIRESTLQKIPYMVIIGDKEISSSDLSGGKKLVASVRTREGEDLGQVNIFEFIEQLKSKIEKYV